MVRVAIDRICNLEMLEAELLDHIEKGAHAADFREQDVDQYRRWFQQNFKIEERIHPPHSYPQIARLYSAGTETGVRHQ